MSRRELSQTGAEFKRREALYEKLKDEVLREAGNRDSLAKAVQRVLRNRELARAPDVAARLRSLIAQREAQLRATAPATGSLLPFSTQPMQEAPPSAEEDSARVLARLEEQFHDHLIHMREAEAGFVLQHLHELDQGLDDPAAVARYAEHDRRFERMKHRRVRFQALVERTLESAVAAARRGDHAEMARALQRLSSAHASHPELFPDQRFEECRRLILKASDTREGVERLIERERAVAAEIKVLVDSVHRFHHVVRERPHDEKPYRQALAEYRRAVQEVQSHDKEWLAGVILELVDLLAEVAPHSGKGGRQVDHFVNGIRSALAHLHKEIRDIDRERAAR